MMAKWFNACLQFRIGIVHFLDASWIARYTSFCADSSLGYCLRFRVNLRIVLVQRELEFLPVGISVRLRRRVPERSRHRAARVYRVSANPGVPQ